jgi:tetratricopeptide (TPR) repeat protein
MFDEDGGFTTRQYLLARYSDERAMLAAVAEDFSRAGALVSFNGKSFDAPVLETRYLFHRLEWVASQQPHIDVLHPARRFWKEDECSLAVLEQQVLGAWREDDVAGFEIPSRYFQFLRSGDGCLLAAVLEHNRRDLIALAGLTSRLLEIVAGGPDYAENAREALALGHVYARARDTRRAIGAFERALTLGAKKAGRRAAEVRADALRSLALSYRRERQYGEAARCWIALIEAGCAEHVEREAIEALAIHHEHRARDLTSARTFAVENVTRASARVAPAQTAEAAQRRLARIERKINEAERLGELLG